MEAYSKVTQWLLRTGSASDTQSAGKRGHEIRVRVKRWMGSSKGEDQITSSVAHEDTDEVCLLSIVQEDMSPSDAQRRINELEAELEEMKMDKNLWMSLSRIIMWH